MIPLSFLIKLSILPGFVWYPLFLQGLNWPLFFFFSFFQKFLVLSFACLNLMARNNLLVSVILVRRAISLGRVAFFKTTIKSFLGYLGIIDSALVIILAVVR